MNMLRVQSGDMDGQDQVEMVEAGQYGDIEQANNDYSVGQQVRIMNDAGHTYVDSILVGHSGVVIRCARDRNADSHITVVYMLLDEFETYGPLIVVKGTASSVCRCGEELQHSAVNDHWSVWRIPVPKHWEVPSRHDGDRARRQAMHSHVESKHWGDKYWQNQKQLQLDLLRHADGTRGQAFDYQGYAHFENDYKEYGGENDKHHFTVGVGVAGTGTSARRRPPDGGRGCPADGERKPYGRLE